MAAHPDEDPPPEATVGSVSARAASCGAPKASADRITTSATERTLRIIPTPGCRRAQPTRTTTRRPRSPCCRSPAPEVDGPLFDHLVPIGQVKGVVVRNRGVDMGGDHPDAVADAHGVGGLEREVLV